MSAVTLAIIEKGHLMFKKLFIRRVVVGSALAAGVGVAGMIGAGTAGAAPGISYDPGPGDPIGIGDNSATGAQADASNDNQALAISVFRPATATADGQNRTGNTVFALDGTAGFLRTNTYPYTDDHDNQVVAINGTALAHGEGTNLVAIGSNVSNKLTTTYVDGTKGYTNGTWLNPLLGVRNTVVVVCGQLQKNGSSDVFNVNNYDASRNGTCG
jgi:hypothetical protein